MSNSIGCLDRNLFSRSAATPSYSDRTRCISSVNMPWLASRLHTCLSPLQQRLGNGGATASGRGVHLDIPILSGLALYCRFFKSLAWVARIPLAS